MGATRVGWLWAVLFLAASPPAFAATVAVAPIRDSGKKGDGDAVRKQVERGLADGGIAVVGANALAAGAKKQGLNPNDLGKPAVLVPVARAAHADAVLQANITGKAPKQELAIRVFNLEGVELWSRSIKLTKGKLANDIPRKIARAVTAALAAAPAPEGAAPDTTATEPAPDTTAVPNPDTAAPTPETTAPPPEGTTATKPKTEPKPKSTDEGETPIVTPKHKPAKPSPEEGEGTRSDERAEGEGTIEGPPKEAKADTAPQPPIIDVGFSPLSLFSRTYSVCPGVTSCSQAGPAPTVDDQGVTRDVPISYKTSAPSLGIALNLELFPVPKLVSISPDLTLTFGVGAEYLRSFSITNNYSDPDTGEPGKFGATISRVTADLLGRLYFHMLNGTGHGGLFGGYLAPQFVVGDNPLLVSSVRKGFSAGADVELPLAGDYLKLAAKGAFAAANPGIDETTLYGQTGKGSGLVVRGGFTGGYSYIGYSAYADFARFSDVFDGGGVLTTNGAVTEETYTSFMVAVHGRY